MTLPKGSPVVQRRQARPALASLSPFQKGIFDQIRDPNSEAHAYAKLYGARGKRSLSGWPEQMDLQTLAEGYGVAPAVCIVALKAVVQILRRGALAETTRHKK